jgi:hypothetical protein
MGAHAVDESLVVTNAKCPLHRAVSGIKGNPEDICSHGVFLSLTLSDHAT